MRICYPRPTAERNAGGAHDGGLNGEYDKWLAGVPWYPCLGVQWGAFPYKVAISLEKVDGVSASTGVQYARFIEDHTATTPYLGFYHAGWSVASGSTKLIEFTITVTDCLGTTDTYPVSMTVYADDHVDARNHFRVVNTEPTYVSENPNGDGSWSAPTTVLTGADVDGSPTLFGTSWASTTHCPNTVIVLFKDGSVINPTGMTNVPGGGSATQIIIQDDYFPRTFIGVYGGTVTADFTSNPHPFNTQDVDGTNDILIKNITFANNSVAARNAVNFGFTTRSHIHDCKLDRFGAAAPSNNDAPFRTSGVGAANFDCTILRCSCDEPYAITANGGNHWGAVSVISWHRGLIDDFTITNMTYSPNGFRNDGMIRIKHDSEDTEFRRINALATSQVVQGSLVLFSTGGGIGAAANKHIRVLLRHCNLYAINSNCVQMTGGQPLTDTEQHSIQVHYSSLRGGVNFAIDAGDDIENAREVLIYKSVLENSIGGFTSTNATNLTTESAIDVSNIKGTSGVLNTDGTPVNSAYIGLYGHTVIS